MRLSTSPKRKAAVDTGGDLAALPPRKSTSSSRRLLAAQKIQEIRDDLRTTGVLSPNSLANFGEVAVAHLYRRGELVLVRGGAITFHSDLVKSKQAALDVPVQQPVQDFCGAYGFNVDLLQIPATLQSAIERHEVVACSSTGHVLVLTDDAGSGLPQSVQLYDKSSAIKDSVTSVAIAERGLYVVGTSGGHVYRLRKQGRVLQAELLVPAQEGSDWFTFGKKLLLPALQAMGVDAHASDGQLPSGDAAIDVASEHAVRRLLLVPRAPHLLVCGNSLSLWSHWDKPGQQVRTWTLPLKKLISQHLQAIKDKSSKGDVMAALNTRVSLNDRFSFGRRDEPFGSVELVDFALLDDKHDTKLGTLVALALYTPAPTPNNTSSSTLWLFTINIENGSGAGSHAATPQVHDCIFLSAGVSPLSAHDYDQQKQQGQQYQNERLTIRPRVYTLLPSWRIYLSWTDRDGRVVLGQIDARAVPALSDALMSELEAYASGAAPSEDVLVSSPPGIATLPTEFHHSEVVCMNATTATSATDGLVVLLRSNKGGRLVQCTPPMGTNTLRWGDRSLAPRDNSAVSLLLDEEGTSVGAIRDALALVRLDDLLEPVTQASLAILDGNRFLPGELSFRRERHAILLERLHGAGITVASGSERICERVRLAHEQLCAAEAVWARYQDMLTLVGRRGTAGFAREAAAAGLDVLQLAMAEYVSERWSEREVDRGDKQAVAERFFSRPSQLAFALGAVLKALKSSFRILQEQQQAFLAAYSVALLLGAALRGAQEGAGEVDVAQQRVPASHEDRESLLPRADDLRLVIIDSLEALTISAASDAQTQQWAARDADEDLVSVEIPLIEFCDHALIDYQAQAVREGVHVTLNFEKQQHEAKLLAAGALMSLGLHEACFNLSEKFLVFEGIMESASSFYPAPCQHLHKGMTQALRVLLRAKGETRARALLRASPSQQQQDMTPMPSEGTYSLGGFAFLWIETHRPDLVELLLALREECPRIFDEEYMSQEGGPLVRKRFAWLAAARDGDLVSIAERTLATAQDSDCRDISACVTLASVAKLAAYASRLESEQRGAPENDLELSRLQYAAERMLLAADTQRTYFPHVAHRLSELGLVDELLQYEHACSLCGSQPRCDECKGAVCARALACLSLLAALLRDEAASRAEVQQRAVLTWEYACSRDASLAELDAVLSSGEAMGEAEQAQFVQSSVLYAVLSSCPEGDDIKPRDGGSGSGLTWERVLFVNARTLRAVKAWANLEAFSG